MLHELICFKTNSMYTHDEYTLGENVEVPLMVKQGRIVTSASEKAELY